MRIFGLEVSRPLKNIPEQKEERGALSDYLSYYGVPYSTSVTNVTFETALNISAVYKAVNLISDSIATLPLEPYTYQDEVLTVDLKQPSYNLLNIEPHPMYGKFIFWKTMVSNMLLHGNAYGYIHRDGLGNPLNFILLYPGDVEVYINDADKKLKYKIINKDGFIDPEDMIHLLNYSTNGIYGKSTIEYGSRSLGIAIASDKNAKGFFENGGNMSGIISVDGRIDPAKAAAIKTAWNQAFSPYTDDTTPGGIAILERGMEYKPISVDPVNSQLLESRKWNVEEIARWFNLPAMKLGITTTQYYNSIESNNLEYLQTTLTPIMERIEGELRRKLYRPSQRGIVIARFNENSVLRADLDSKINYMSKSIDAGLMTINEGRKEMGLKSIKDGDTTIIKSGNQTLDQLLSDVEPTPPVEQSAPEEDKLPDPNVEHRAPGRQRSKNRRDKND